MLEDTGEPGSEEESEKRSLSVTNTHMLLGSWKEAPSSTIGLMERKEALRKQPEYSLKLKEESWCSFTLKVTEADPKSLGPASTH